MCIFLQLAHYPPKFQRDNTVVSNNISKFNSNAGDLGFAPGEELTYKVYYNLNFVWIAAGEVTFKVDDAGDNFHFTATGRTYNSYEWFYKVRDSYSSYVDKKTMLPLVSQRTVSENKYHLFDNVTFDQNSKSAQFERGPAENNIDNRGAKKFDDAMHDILSVVYYSRTLDYQSAQIGQEFPIKVLLDEEVYPLKYKLENREQKNIRGIGNWDVLFFTPQLVDGRVFTKEAKMKIWASNDANRIPLMIESPVSVGSVKVVLKSWKNLKNDTKAKVKE